MLLTYEIQATDLGAAIAVATRRAQADGATHVSISGTSQVAPTTWRITVFADVSSPAITQRQHACTGPYCCR